MEPNSRQIMDEVLRLQERVTAVQGAAMTPAHLQDAVAAGIKAAVSDPAVWSSAIEAVQTRAKAEAGGWLLGSIRSVISKIAWILVVGFGIYTLGGWTALAAWFKSGAGTQ